MITTDNRHLATLAQSELARLGFYTAAIDGQWGAKSETAFAAYVNKRDAQTIPAGDFTDPAWLVIARKELGTTEIASGKDNPRIVEYHSATSLKATDDETAWCSAFVNWCLKQAGVKGSNSAMARSFLSWGKAVEQPRLGCIVVFSRGQYPQGHVAFYVGRDGNRIKVLGGNQSDKVCIVSSSTEQLLGYRWPA